LLRECKWGHEAVSCQIVRELAGLELAVRGFGL
jgi:hypothetical protein